MSGGRESIPKIPPGRRTSPRPTGRSASCRSGSARSSRGWSPCGIPSRSASGWCKRNPRVSKPASSSPWTSRRSSRSFGGPIRGGLRGSRPSDRSGCGRVSSARRRTTSTSGPRPRPFAPASPARSSRPASSTRPGSSSSRPAASFETAGEADHRVTFGKARVLALASMWQPGLGNRDREDLADGAIQVIQDALAAGHRDDGVLADLPDFEPLRRRRTLAISSSAGPRRASPRNARQDGRIGSSRRTWNSSPSRSRCGASTPATRSIVGRWR